MNRRLAALLLGLSLVSPGCATARVYPDRPAPHRPIPSAYEEGFRHGLIDGRWAGHRDRGKTYRIGFWDDARYRRGSEGYRPWFGSRFAYADGYRAGYERGYFERHGRRYEPRRY
jgi:hypothetical protein